MIRGSKNAAKSLDPKPGAWVVDFDLGTGPDFAGAVMRAPGGFTILSFEQIRQRMADALRPAALAGYGPAMSQTVYAAVQQHKRIDAALAAAKQRMQTWLLRTLPTWLAAQDPNV